jgi:hypothetical protein
MKLIATQTLTSAGGSITFSDIPQNFTDLCVLLSARSTDGTNNSTGRITFNGSSSNFSWKNLLGVGSGAPETYTDTSNILWYPQGNGTTANTFDNNQLYITNYAGSTNKSFSFDGVIENNATAGIQSIWAGRWSSSAAITSIAFSTGANLAAGSTASLYGIGGTGDGWAPKATGGVISKIDGYYVHTFTASDTFTPTVALDVEYLVVAGGGGGGANTASGNSGGVAGGGAGGYRTNVGGSLFSVIATPYTITVGAGGNGSTTSAVNGSNGSNSTFSSITSSGGGGGGATNTGNGNAGGSGGGGYGFPLNTFNGGAGNLGGYTPVEGFAGARGHTDGTTYTTGGGGGGASAAAIQRTSSTGGDGGAGSASSITGTSIVRAGGGGGGGANGAPGGVGGIGGGGDGSAALSNATSGTVNTGGGGGGAGGGSTAVFSGGNGGSGIVVVRYLA